MRDEGVTVAAGVQTVWLGVLDHLDATGGEVPTLERVIIGGSTCPGRADPAHGGAASARGADELGHDRAVAAGHHRAARRGRRARVASGRPPVGLDLKLTDADGVALPQQRNVVGHLKVKGASVVDRYFKAEDGRAGRRGLFRHRRSRQHRRRRQPDHLRAAPRI